MTKMITYGISILKVSVMFYSLFWLFDGLAAI